MNNLSKILRISGVLILIAIGAWVIFNPVSPGTETVAHQRAILSAAYAEQKPAEVPSMAGGVAEPVTVNLADVEFEPIDSMYDRWLAGEIDLDEQENRVSAAEKAALQEEALTMGPQGGAAWGNESQSPDVDAPTLLNSFDALDVSDCCGGGTSVPPDSDMAAGLNHLIAVENSSFVIYNKAGVLQVGPVLFDNFLSTSGTFDPTVLYDSEDDRYVMGIEDGAYFYLMVSDTSDPTGSWTYYSFDARYYGDEFFDYPHIGIGDHAIFMGSNMFGGSVPLGYEGRIYVMDKNAAYSASGMSWRSASVGVNGGTPQPLNLTGFSQGTVPQPFNTHYFITDQYDGCTGDLWAWPDALGSGSPSIIQTYNVCTAVGLSGGMPLSVPQNGVDDIEGNDWRFRGFEYRNGFGWTTDSVSHDFGGGTVNYARYIKIDLSGAPYPITQSGFGAWGYPDHVIFPDLAVDACDNVALGFERSSSSMYPSIEWTGALAGSSGLMDLPSRLKTGETTYFSFDGDPLRWGDYSGMAIDPDGKTFWYMGEYAKNISGYQANYGNYIAELTYDCNVGGPPPADFDGDGDTNISVYRPSNGNWYDMDTGMTSWGLAGDLPVPSDYDGDGTVDVAVYRPSNGKWYVFGHTPTKWGASGDVPMPCDYDGDGSDEFAVYRPSNGNWYIMGQSFTSWGLGGDIPVPADYDGDGACDIAVYRPSNGKWYVYGQGPTKWGATNDIPVPGDYNGDGTDEMAVYRPSNGNWYIMGQSFTSWGLTGDIPVPGDYDGDGTLDIAVLRESNGKWYIMGGTPTTWYFAGDYPLPVRDTNADATLTNSKAFQDNRETSPPGG